MTARFYCPSPSLPKFAKRFLLNPKILVANMGRVAVGREGRPAFCLLRDHHQPTNYFEIATPLEELQRLAMKD
jgi:hypothetical protein